MCHANSCSSVKEACTRKGTPCLECWTECKGPPVQRPPHKFSKGVRQAQAGIAPVRADALQPFSSNWLDDDTARRPLSNLEKALVSMLHNGVPLKNVDAPKNKPLYRLPRDERVHPRPAVSIDTTPVPGMPGVRVWVSNATKILEATGMDVEEFPNEPMKPNTYQGSVTAVYVRFRIEGKLENAGAGYWLAPSLSHLVTSIYGGLAFNELKQKDVVDIGLIKGVRTVVAFPCCYSARVSPEVTTWSCKKGNIDYSAQRWASFRVGDVGVGHPEWVEATKDDGGMNARSQGAGVAHNRLLAIMTELLTTRILEEINLIP